ncbi:MAG: hypothetical protein R6W71_04640 [Bacteroidales bacterium]
MIFSGSFSAINADTYFSDSVIKRSLILRIVKTGLLIKSNKDSDRCAEFFDFWQDHRQPFFDLLVILDEMLTKGVETKG